MKVVDMHCDTIAALWKREKEGKPISLLTNDLHLDLKKMQKGDYLLQNFAMFVFQGEEPDLLVDLLEKIDVYNRMLAANSNLIAPVYCYEDILKNSAEAKMSALLTMEEGAPLKGNLSILRQVYRLGVRMIALTWNFENEIGYPNTIVKSPDYNPAKRYGLKEQGIAIVQEMNRLGMIVDVSHLGDDGFWDVIRYSDKPFVASHSNARSVQSHTRNLTDEMIRALADHGGVMGLNFCGEFLGDDGCTLDNMIRHIRHIVNVGGIGCIGLGTDFDGIGGKLEIRDGSQMQKLYQAMDRAGFRESDIEAVFSGNVLRLYRDVL